MWNNAGAIKLESMLKAIANKLKMCNHIWKICSIVNFKPNHAVNLIHQEMCGLGQRRYSQGNLSNTVIFKIAVFRILLYPKWPQISAAENDIAKQYMGLYLFKEELKMIYKSSNFYANFLYWVHCLCTKNPEKCKDRRIL